MSYRAVQPNFSRGELAPALYGRFDVDAYNAAVKRALNVIILKFGGLTKRPGTRLVAEVLDRTRPTRLIPFQFSLSQTYALELGHGYMSPCAQGGRIVETELNVTNISNDVNAAVTAAFHGYSPGDRVYLSGVAGEIGNLLNGRAWRVVTVLNANTFTIIANTTGLAPFTTATGGITRTSPPPPDPVPPVIPPPVNPPTPPIIAGGGNNGMIS